MEDRSTAIYVAVWLTLVVATISLIMRLISRHMTKAGYSYDDALGIIAFITGVGYCAVVLVWTANYCLGKTLDLGPKHLTREQILEKSWLLLWCSSMTYSFSIAFSKFAILTFYWRIFKHSAIRLPIQILLGASLAWFIMRLFMVTLQCIPTRAFWDLSMKADKCKLNESAFFFGTVLTHVILDILILVLPVIQIGKLRLRYGQKIAVIALFLFGILTCIASIFVLIESIHFDSKTTEMPLDSAMNEVWAAVEVNLAIVSASLPLLRPIFRKMIPGSFLSSANTQSQPISGLSHARPIKLTMITKTKEPDESSSTHQLAESEDGSPEFDSRTSDGRQGPKTHISSPWSRYPASTEGEYGGGIHVRSEMAIQVEHV